MEQEKYLIGAFRKWFVFCLFVVTTLVYSGFAQAACTASYFEKAYLNEYFFGTGTNYLEVFIPNNNVVTAADWSSWTVDVVTSAGSTSYPLNIANVCSAGSKTYLVYDVSTGLPGTGGAVNVILKDGSGNEIDYLKADNGTPIPVYTAPQCTYAASHDIDLVVASYGNKDFARFPDGKGSWSISSLTGANTTNTRCASNDATIIKSVSASTINVGAAASFTITVFNPSNSSLANVVVTDLLPSGLIFDSYSATTGTYVSGTGVWTIGTVAKNTGATLTINFHGNTVGVYTNTATLTYTGISYTASDSAIANIVMPITVSDFNAFETSTAANSVTGRIYTKLAGSAFGLDVVAISGGVQNSFSGNVKVELLANTGTSGSGYGADNCPTSNSVIQTVASAAIASGRSTVNFSAVANAYQDVRVRVSYPTTSSTVIACSTDSFTIRPTAFTITSTDATNTDVTGTPVIKAGANFNLTATAVAGYGGTPLIDNTKIVGTATAGTLAGSFVAANSATGIATGSTFTYSEVGNFGLNANAVYDSSFTSIDQATDCTADFSNTLVGGKYGCNIGSVAVPQTTGSSGFGRFIPDHFDTVVTGPMTCATGLTCPAGGLVYSGQAFTTQVIARNAAGATTVNYTGSYARAVTLTAWDSLGGSTANPGAGTLTLNTVLATAFTAGTATTLTPVYTLGTLTTAPTDIYIRATESTGGDSVTSLRIPAASSVEGGVKVVNGRIRVSNAYGSELLPLKLTATAQYYNGSGWATVNTDNASNLTLSATYNLLDKNGAVTGTTAASKSPASGLSAGILTITLAKPSGGTTGTATISPGKPAYLQLVPGTGTFGVYSGNNNLIYQRESY